MITWIRVFDLKGWRKIGIKSEFVIDRVSVGYKSSFQKVLNWTSKGRYLDRKRASFASQLGVFSKPKGHLLKPKV